MPKLLERWAKRTQPPKLPMPLGGQISLFIYYWFYFYWIYMPKEDDIPFHKILKILNTPYDVQAYMFCNFKYVADKTPDDEWLPPIETYLRREDDCEGWAGFGGECLKDKYRIHILCMYDDKAECGHATLLIEDEKHEWRSIGTFGYQHHNGSIPEIIPDWKPYRNWTRYKLYDEHGEVIRHGSRDE